MIRWIPMALFVGLPGTAIAQAKPDSIEARLERVEAQLAIQQIQVDYAGFLDSRDYTQYVALFTPDAEWMNANGSHKGREAIRKMLSMLGPEGAQNKSNYHLVSNPRVIVNGDTATATSRYLFMMRGPDGTPRPSLTGIYTDELVRLDGKWLIKRRVANDIMPTPDEWRKIIAEQRAKQP